MDVVRKPGIGDAFSKDSEIVMHVHILKNGIKIKLAGIKMNIFMPAFQYPSFCNNSRYALVNRSKETSRL